MDKKSSNYTIQIEVLGVVEKQISAESMEDAIVLGRELVNGKFFVKNWEEIDSRATLVGVQATWSLYE